MSDMEGIYKEKLLTQIFNPQLVEDKFYKSLKSLEMLDDVEEKISLENNKRKIENKKLRTSHTESPYNNLGSEINNQSGEFVMGKKDHLLRGKKKKRSNNRKKFS